MQRPKQCQIVDDWYDLPYGANSSQHARDPRQSPPDALASDVKGRCVLGDITANTLYTARNDEYQRGIGAPCMAALAISEMSLNSTKALPQRHSQAETATAVPHAFNSPSPLPLHNSNPKRKLYVSQSGKTGNKTSRNCAQGHPLPANKRIRTHDLPPSFSSSTLLIDLRSEPSTPPGRSGAAEQFLSTTTESMQLHNRPVVSHLGSGLSELFASVAVEDGTATWSTSLPWEPPAKISAGHQKSSSASAVGSCRPQNGDTALLPLLELEGQCQRASSVAASHHDNAAPVAAESQYTAAFPRREATRPLYEFTSPPMQPLPHRPLISEDTVVPEVENTDVGLPTIDAATLATLLTGHHGWPIDRVMPVDCRYSYEYAGGCITGAVHIQQPGEMEAATLKADTSGSTDKTGWSRTAVVLYGEFSVTRAPRMFRHLRQVDRWNHLHDGSELTIPHLYLLSRGYVGFQERFSHLCTSTDCIRMHDLRFESLRQHELSLSDSAWGVTRRPRRHRVHDC